MYQSKNDDTGTWAVTQVCG